MYSKRVYGSLYCIGAIKEDGHEELGIVLADCIRDLFLFEYRSLLFRSWIVASFGIGLDMAESSSSLRFSIAFLLFSWNFLLQDEKMSVHSLLLRALSSQH
ncbi:uncharacterized protein LOC108805279 isoform X2 [Raphanus sativus]|uniref:Uncharacterized protein LOC108805279 isoform X2 n=1 Tax=Raphanus sativus TaxID=3726 RepID=A0A6J0JAW6_RAPSA|nr:uncharacterized protein LOC108805279 isoform X2 [Raphanus sativus]